MSDVEWIDEDIGEIPAFQTTKDYVIMSCFMLAKTKNTRGKLIEKRLPCLLYRDNKMDKVQKTLYEEGQHIKLAGTEYMMLREPLATDTIPTKKTVRMIDGIKHISKQDEAFQIQRIREFLKKFVHLPNPEDYSILALYVFATHFFDAWSAFPYMFIHCLEYDSGKTTTGKNIGLLTNSLFFDLPRPTHVYNASDRNRCVLIHDEAELLWQRKPSPDNRDIISLYNSGYKRGSRVPRFRKCRDGTQEFDMYNSFCPKILISTEWLPRSLLTRCIRIELEKAPLYEEPEGKRIRKEVDPFHKMKYSERNDLPDKKLEGDDIRNTLYCLRMKMGMDVARMAGQEIGIYDTEGWFRTVDNRTLEIYKPLIQICTRYAPEWRQDLLTHIERVTEKKIETLPLQDQFTWAIRYIVENIELFTRKIDYYDPRDPDYIYINDGAIMRVLNDFGFAPTENSLRAFLKSVGWNEMKRVSRHDSHGQFYGRRIPLFSLAKEMKKRRICDDTIVSDDYYLRNPVGLKSIEKKKRQSKSMLVMEYMTGHDGLSVDDLGSAIGFDCAEIISRYQSLGYVYSRVDGDKKLWFWNKGKELKIEGVKYKKDNIGE